MIKDPVELVPDCWLRIIDVLDVQSLGRLLSTNKAMQGFVAPQLYRYPFKHLGLRLQSDRRLMLGFLILSQAGWPGLNDQEFMDVYGISPFQKPGTTFSFDYFNLVKELPDSQNFFCHGFKYEKCNKKMLWVYRHFFATKISKMELDLWDPESIQSIHLFSHLQCLVLHEEYTFNEGYQQWKVAAQDSSDEATNAELESRIQTLLRIHDCNYPGTLKFVDFKSFRGRGKDYLRMLQVKEAMGGKWCREFVNIKLPESRDLSLVQVLQSKDLAQHLKRLHVDKKTELSFSRIWDNLLIDFLSNCRHMEHVSFASLEAMLLDRMLDKQKQVDQHHNTESTLRTRWRGVQLSNIQATNEATVPKLVQKVVEVLGDGLEKLGISVYLARLGLIGHSDDCVEFEISESWNLPRLYRLDIDYPWIGNLSFSGFQSLRSLTLRESTYGYSLATRSWTSTNNFKWTAPRLLEDLAIQDSIATRFDFECLQYLKRLRELSVEFTPSEHAACAGIPLIDMNPQFQGATRLGEEAQPFRKWDLPKLTCIRLTNEPARIFQMQFLDACPELETYNLHWHCSDSFGELELDLSGLRGYNQPDWQYPRLQDVELTGDIYVPANTLATFLSVPGPQSLSPVGLSVARLFPKLQELRAPELLTMVEQHKEEEEVAIVIGHAMGLDRQLVLCCEAWTLPANAIQWWQEWLTKVASWDETHIGECAVERFTFRFEDRFYIRNNLMAQT